MVRGRYAETNIDRNINTGYYDYTRSKYFCSQGCQSEWLNVHMENIEQGRPIEFIRHRRESQGYRKVTNEDSYRPYTTIERVDNA